MFFIPLKENSKEPIGKWKEQATNEKEQHADWLRDGLNLGFPADPNGMTVIDIDRKEVAREIYKEHPEIFKNFVETRKGIHIYTAGLVPTRYLYYGGQHVGEIKGIGSYVVAPPSIVDAWHYEHLKKEKPVEFPADLFPIPATITKPVRNAIRYISKIKAISGKGGHNQTFRAACKLRDSGLSEVEALAAMVEWNQTNCEPTWSIPELLHKVRDAYAKLMKEK